MPFVNKENLI